MSFESRIMVKVGRPVTVSQAVAADANVGRGQLDQDWGSLAVAVMAGRMVLKAANDGSVSEKLPRKWPWRVMEIGSMPVPE